MQKEATLTDSLYFLKGIFQNNEIVLREIYSKYFDKISNLIKSNNGDAEDAKDIFQEALLVIYEKAKDKEFKMTSSFYTYLYAICRNLWYSRLRKTYDKEVSINKEFNTADESEIEEVLIRHNRYNLYRKKWEELTDECKKILQMFFDKHSMAIITEKLNYSSISYAKKRKFICKEKLTVLIQKDKSYKSLTYG